MLGLDMSIPMATVVDEIRKKIVKKSCVWNITLTFFTDIFPELQVHLFKSIDKFTIEQDFINNITDKLTCELILDREPYITLYHFRKNLKCRMIISQVDPTLTHKDAIERYLETSKDLTFIFNCAIVEYEDIFKKVAWDRIWPQWWDGKFEKDAAVGDRDEHDRDRVKYRMKVEFIFTDIYSARKQMINLLMKDTQMDSVLEAVVTHFHIAKEQITIPDNTWMYTNLLIPYMHFEQVMSYLQNAPGLGVYNNGFNTYITRYWENMIENCWYVYPRYGTPREENPIHVYAVGSKIQKGALCWHTKEGPEGIMILTDEEIKVINWSDLGTENAPTGIDALASQLTLDGHRTLIADNEWYIERHRNLLQVLSTDPVDKMQVVKFEQRRGKDNDYKIKSELRAYQGTSLMFQWNFAEPWVFPPHTKVYFHYDHPQCLKMIVGQVEKVVYEFVRDQGSPIIPFMVCTAYVTLNYDNIQAVGEAHI